MPIQRGPIPDARAVAAATAGRRRPLGIARRRGQTIAAVCGIAFRGALLSDEPRRNGSVSARSMRSAGADVDARPVSAAAHSPSGFVAGSLSLSAAPVLSFAVDSGAGSCAGGGGGAAFAAGWTSLVPSSASTFGAL